MEISDKRSEFERNGYVAVDGLVNDQEVAWYLDCYDRILSGQIEAGQWRLDLGSGQPVKHDDVENITQVMWPSELIPDLPDSHAVSCWIALDEATADNGCMWFAPGSHRQSLRKHRWHGKVGGALKSDGYEAECDCVPRQPGSCIFHAGGVVHYNRGNFTAGHRRAWIINFRPEAMIRLEREQGFDHGKTWNVRENRM